MVSKQDGELFGQTEFQMRDHLLRMGAQALDRMAQIRYGLRIRELRERCIRSGISPLE